MAAAETKNDKKSTFAQELQEIIREKQKHEQKAKFTMLQQEFEKIIPQWKTMMKLAAEDKKNELAIVVLSTANGTLSVPSFPLGTIETEILNATEPNVYQVIHKWATSGENALCLSFEWMSVGKTMIDSARLVFKW